MSGRFGRAAALLGGLTLYGFSMALMVRAGLGLDPWDVFHLGLTELVNRWVPLSYGAVITIVSVLVLLLWIPLRQRPGIGTVLNVVVIGLATDLGLAVMPPVEGWPAGSAMLAAGIVLNGIAGALYVGARLGPGPRDGLWVAISARTGWSIRAVRTILELTVLGIGWLLGGTIGVGTVAYALAIGPLVQWFMPKVEVTWQAPALDPIPEADRQVCGP